jgi:hypothetical protein
MKQQRKKAPKSLKNQGKSRLFYLAGAEGLEPYTDVGKSRGLRIYHPKIPLFCDFLVILSLFLRAFLRAFRAVPRRGQERLQEACC